MTDDNVRKIADLIEGGPDAPADAVRGDSVAPQPLIEGGPLKGESPLPDAGGDNDEIGAEFIDPPADAAQISRDIIAACALEPQNDTGNSQRFLRHFGECVLNVREHESTKAAGWHRWTGTHWDVDGGNEAAMLYAQRVAPRIALEADFLTATPAEQKAINAGVDAEWALTAMERTRADWTDDDRRKAAVLQDVIAAGKQAAGELKKRQLARRRFAVSSGNGARLREMLNQSIPHRTVAQDKLDADALAFNCLNGTLRFTCYDIVDDECPDPEVVRTKEFWIARLDPHDPADLISKVAPVNFAADAPAPRFRAAIERFQPNRAQRRWLQKYFGYALTGLNGEQCMLFNYGAGSNWKSTFIEIVCRVMGDYATTLKFESLAGDGVTTGAQANPDFARLPGARLVRASEPDRGVHLKEGLIKSLTGGEPMLTRQNFGNFFSFYPVFKLSLSGNHKPEISGVDHGIWRRIRFVVWPVTIADSEKREFNEVIAELWEERDGILAWLVEGALMYFREGLAPPPEIVDATEEYREEMDIVGEFIRACVTLHKADDEAAEVPYVPAQEIFEAYEAYCYANGHRPWKQKAFGAALTQKGIRRDRKSSQRRYLWIALHDVPPRARAGARNEPPHPADEEVPL